MESKANREEPTVEASLTPIGLRETLQWLLVVVLAALLGITGCVLIAGVPATGAGSSMGSQLFADTQIHLSVPASFRMPSEDERKTLGLRSVMETKALNSAPPASGVSRPLDWVLVGGDNIPGKIGLLSASTSPIHIDVFIQASEINHFAQRPSDWKLLYRIESGTTYNVASARVSFDDVVKSAHKECPRDDFHIISDTASDLTYEEVTVGCSGSPDTDRLSRILLFSSDWSMGARHPEFRFSYVVKGKAMTSEQRKEGTKLIQSHSILTTVHAPSIIELFDSEKMGVQGIIYDLPQP